MVMSKSDMFAQLGLFVIKGFFEADFCARLRSKGCIATLVPATVVKEGVAVIDERRRKTKRADFCAGTLTSLEARLTAPIPELEKYFNVSLMGCQPPQLLVYEKGDYFKIHQDNARQSDMPRYLKDRKLSAVIFLNSEARKPVEGLYCGGTLTFYKLRKNPTWDNCRTPVIGHEGLLVVFRSDVFHEVTPVTYGERYTIVSWFA
jgi:SM-20-related protein